MTVATLSDPARTGAAPARPAARPTLASLPGATPPRGAVGQQAPVGLGASGLLALRGALATQSITVSALTLPMLGAPGAPALVASPPLLAGVLPVVAPPPPVPAVQLAPRPSVSPVLLSPMADRVTPLPAYADLLPAAALVAGSLGGLVAVRVRRRAA